MWEASVPSNIRTSKGNEYFLARKCLQHFLECVPSSSVVRKVLSLLHVSVLLAENPTAATSAAPTGQGSRDDTRAANAKQCADSATRCGLSTRLNLLSSEKGWEEEYEGGRGPVGILFNSSS